MLLTRVYLAGWFQVATYRIFDGADEFRIAIIGRFAGACIDEVRRCWEDALQQTNPRRLTVDISRLAGYDANGRKLLAEMYRHGTELAARTPSSLVFLSEIANTPRTPAPLITAPTAPEQLKRPETPKFRIMASGQ